MEQQLPKHRRNPEMGVQDTVSSGWLQGMKDLAATSGPSVVCTINSAEAQRDLEEAFTVCVVTKLIKSSVWCK